MGWNAMNLIATIGAWMLAAGVLVFLVNVVISRRRGALAGDDPWGAATLEWSTASPPAPHNFDALPVVHGGNPRWEPRREPSCVGGLAVDAREVLITTVGEARPDLRVVYPDSSPWPFISALATTLLFVASIFTPWAVVWASLPVTAAMIAWFWPSRRSAERSQALEQLP
jgi:cytochrome c oxidase subunit 1